MYRQHFGLREKPFRVVPSPRYLFASEIHDESLSRILYGIREARGFVVVSGGVGLGKTTVLLAVLERLNANVRTALIFNPVNDFEQLLRMVCYEFEIDPDGLDEVELMRALNLYLVSRHQESESSVLIIDEAQNLPLEVLEKIRTLSNLQTEESSLLQIVLVGQPELRDKLDDPRLLQLRQRIGVWHELLPLSESETRSYIWHRLRLAGAAMAESVVNDAACAAIYTVCEGVPRLINQVCDTSLVIAYGADRPTVEAADVLEAASELQLMSDPAGEPQAPKSEDSKTIRTGTNGRWLWAALVPAFVGVVLISGLGRQSGSNDHPDIVLARAVQANDEIDPNLTGLPGLDQLRLTELRRAADRVLSMRKDKHFVYSVHLASFRNTEEAESYAREILVGYPEWTQPMFLDTTSNTPLWYRVMAGGFLERAEASRWARAIMKAKTVSYARVDRLPAGADAVDFTGGVEHEQEGSHEQHS